LVIEYLVYRKGAKNSEEISINSYFGFRENIRRNAARIAVTRWRKVVRSAWQRIFFAAWRAINKLLCFWL
jgi:hypothetical protein